MLIFVLNRIMEDEKLKFLKSTIFSASRLKCSADQRDLADGAKSKLKRADFDDGINSPAQCYCAGREVHGREIAVEEPRANKCILAEHGSSAEHSVRFHEFLLSATKSDFPRT